jgi:hypothetical protein
MADPTKKLIEQMLGKAPIISNVTDEPMPELTSAQKQFLSTYASNGGITKAALKAAGVSREELAEWKADNPKFKNAIKDVEQHWIEELRKMAFMRAQTKSDVLLMFLLKALQPEVYDDDVRKQQFVGLSNQKDNIPVRATLIRDNNITFNVLPPEQKDEPEPEPEPEVEDP